jgi:hypothetical protein
MGRKNRRKRWSEDEHFKQLRHPLLNLLTVIEIDSRFDRWASSDYIAERLAEKLRYSYSGWFNSMVGRLLRQLSEDGTIEIKLHINTTVNTLDGAFYRLPNALERLAKV